MIKSYHLDLLADQATIICEESETVSVRLTLPTNNFVYVGSSDVDINNGFSIGNSRDRIVEFVVNPGDKFCALSQFPITINVLVMSLVQP